jgi:small-conductance mechanosensitive channel
MSLKVLVITFGMMISVYGIEQIYKLLRDHPSVHARVLNYFGYKKGQLLTEFLILKLTTQFLIIILSLFWIAKFSAFSNQITLRIYDQFIHGIQFANTTLYPTRVLAGILFFCLVYLTARAISTKITGRQQFEDELETQATVASIITYTGFTLALILGALIAGFNFTELAMIASALSVGIGLGLQNIINNFVSGLIILIEKPIKPGDRISIDGIEGFVKKIHIRSTQLISAGHEEVIIPNSDFITKNITNYTLSDKHSRMSFNIHVAYGNDTFLVRDTLLAIANQHQEVIKTECNKPTVLLESLEYQALTFKLSCLIRDVNKKSTVQSDINFEIDRIFREKKIEMATYTSWLNQPLAKSAIL